MHSCIYSLFFQQAEKDDDEKDNESESSSPTPPMEITGLVQGEATSNGELQSQGGLIQIDDDNDEVRFFIFFQKKPLMT